MKGGMMRVDDGLCEVTAAFARFLSYSSVVLFFWICLLGSLVYASHLFFRRSEIAESVFCSLQGTWFS
jgi:hypothetical protein